MKKSKLSTSLLTAAFVMVTVSLFAVPAPPASVPDASSSAALMSVALAGLAVVRKFVR